MDLDSLRKEEIHFDDSADFVKWLTNFLGPNFIEFEGASSRDLAIGIGNQQAGRWNKLLSILDGHNWQSQTAIQNNLKIFQQIITAALTNASRVNTTGGKIVLSSNLPILTADPPEIRLEQGRAFPFLTSLAIARRTRDQLLYSNNQKAIDWLIPISAIDLANLSDSKSQQFDEYIKNSLSKNDEAITQLKEGLESFKIAAVEEFESKRNELSIKQTEIDALINRISESEKARNDSWNSEKGDALQALQDEVKEFAKIESSINLWQTKARWHTFNYLTLAVVFGFALIAIAYLLVFGHVQGFIAELTKIPADHQFLGVALLAIPTLAIAWLLRFIARLSIQNLALANDARQRHAQVNTYLRLLGDTKKPISEKERILALAALFRPLPGQGPDDVSPPTIADLLLEAQKKVLK